MSVSKPNSYVTKHNKQHFAEIKFVPYERYGWKIQFLEKSNAINCDECCVKYYL